MWIDSKQTPVKKLINGNSTSSDWFDLFKLSLRVRVSPSNLFKMHQIISMD